MKRKFLLALLSISMMIACTIGLAACDFGGGHSHDMTYHSAVDATCTEDGNIEYWYCDGCGKYFSDEEGKHEVTDITIAAKGHTWGDWEVTQEATCQEKGSKTRTCSVCNETESEEMPLAEHSYGEWQVTEKATCTEDGEQKRTCEVCGHEETQTLPALGHTWDDWQIVEEATCKDGLRKHVCETCGAEEEEIIPASGEHKYIDTVIPPTVDEPGYTLHKCEICGEEYKDTYVDITFTEGLAYQLSADKEYYILTGIGDAIDTYLYLPASVNNKPVKEIAAKAFKDNAEITGVYIGSGVEVIGDSAFDGCTSLKDITLFDSIKEIGVGAFEDTAYYNNRDNWENSALYIGSCLIDVRETALGTLDIKDGTHIIGAAAVADCVNILEVNIPDTVRYINRQAFAGCNTLEEVTVPSNVETMGVNAFYGCTSLKKLTIPFIGETAEDTTSPFGYLFGTVNDMTNFEAVPQSLTEVIVTGGETVADSAFYGLEKLTKIVLPETIKIIGEQAFSGCSNLVNFVIPANVESIGTEAFKDCAALTSVAVPENVTSIGLGAFGGCSKLESIILPFVGQNLDGKGETHFGYIFGAQSYSDNKNTVPESLKKVEITKAESIGNYAFSGCSGLTSIVIPDSVTRIGSSAFSNCVSLTSITIPASVTRIGEEVFYNCRSLTSITIPEGVTNVGKRAFINCISLTSITIPDSVVSIEIDVFEFCSSIESIYFQGDITDWLNIDFEGSNSNPLFNGAKLYLNNELVTELIIPDGVTEIKPHAFDGCNSLTSVTIPSSVTSIGSSAFYNSGLTSIVIPDSVTSIGNSAFGGCSSLESIYYQGDIASWCAISGLDNLMTYGSSSKTLYINGQEITGDFAIPDDVTTIPSYAFINCNKLTSIIIPSSVTSICEGAFSGCSSLESITLPFVGGNYSATSASSSTLFGYIFGTSSYTGGVATRQYYSTGDYKYTTYYIPTTLRSVTITGGNMLYGAFYNCSGLTDITIPSSVTNVGERAFINCISLTSITIPDSVVSIEIDVFEFCSSIESIYFQGDITDWLNIDFEGSNSNPLFNGAKLYLNNELVTELIIPDGVTEIKPHAFDGCNSLTSVTIPSSVTSIGSYAFYNCSGLTGITIPSSMTSIGSYAFYNCSGLTGITIPSSVTSIGSGAFCWCSSLTDITIPEGVTRIGGGAFSGCSSLESITLPFVGGYSATSASESTLFGYIFGTSSYTGGVATEQHYSGISYYYATYYIPATLRTVTITGGNILYGAFYNCDSLTSITIPSSVTSIGERAFYNCSNLTSITIPEGVTSIEGYAFYNCSNLTIYCEAASEPSGWDSDWNYSNCPIVWDSKNNEVATDGNIYAVIDGIRYSFKDGVATVVGHTTTISGDITIPATVTYKKVTYNVTSISEGAFRYCSSLTSITIPSSVTSIGDWAFSGCSGLTDIAIPEGVTSIGDWAFSDCSGLTDIAIPEGVTSIGERAFYNCSNLTSITIPSSVTSIGDWAFSDCSSLISVTIPSSVTSIGSNAFYGCDLLIIYCEAKEQPNGWSDDWNDCPVIWNCNNNNVANDGYIYFLNDGIRYKLRDGVATTTRQPTNVSGEIIIPESIMYKNTIYSVTSIGNYAFYGCSSLMSISIPNSVTSIGDSAFSNCSSLASIVIPDSVMSIGSSAFDNCVKLIDYKDGVGYVCNWVVVCYNDVADVLLLPHGTVGIADYVFGYSSIESITIPDSLKFIGKRAFFACSSLKSVTFGNGVASIGDYAFTACSSLTSITIPDSVTSIGFYAFSGCTFMNAIFENSNGWKGYYADSSPYVEIPSLRDSYYAAIYLTTRYTACSWIRSQN